MSALGWTTPELFYLLPLALLPWLIHNHSKTVAWSKLVPVDPIASWINILLKCSASLIILSLILAVADPHIPEQSIDRYGEGAEFIVLLDRSRSMDEIFARPPLNSFRTERQRFKSKRVVSTDYLLEFVEKRPDDRFGYVYFSTQSVEILPLTYNKQAILATIRAGGLGKGISKTNIVEALQLAAKMYEKEAYRGSRNVLLISDGGQVLTEDEKRRLTTIYQQMNLNLYWIYLRSLSGMTLDETAEDSVLWEDLPERKLHAFFKTLTVPYQAYEAGSLAEYAAAIADIDRQQYQRLLVSERIPKQSKADVFLWFALAGLLVLVASFWLSVAGIRQAYRKTS